jgi:hypothetical protein
MLQEMKSNLKNALDNGKKILFIDESMFTSAQRLTHAYSHKRNNIRVE